MPPTKQIPPNAPVQSGQTAPGKPAKSKKRKALNFFFAGLALGAVMTAVATELAKPAGERTWHGRVWGFLPYDFRAPTLEAAKAAFWSPDDPIVVPRLFGLGWTINVGAVVKRLTEGKGESKKS